MKLCVVCLNVRALACDQTTSLSKRLLVCSWICGFFFVQSYSLHACLSFDREIATDWPELLYRRKTDNDAIDAFLLILEHRPHNDADARVDMRLIILPDRKLWLSIDELVVYNAQLWSEGWKKLWEVSAGFSPGCLPLQYFSSLRIDYRNSKGRYDAEIISSGFAWLSDHLDADLKLYILPCCSLEAPFIFRPIFSTNILRHDHLSYHSSNR